MSENVPLSEKVRGVGIDIETTDLYPSRGQIIQIAAIGFDKDFQEVSSFQIEINKWTDKFPHSYRVYGDAEAIEMHVESGLLTHVRELGVEWNTAITMLDEYLSCIIPEGKKFPLMGSSVQFDRDWLKYYAKDVLKAHFTYRNMDASSVYEAIKLLPQETQDSIQEEIDQEVSKLDGVDHHALYDIRKSLSYWRVYSRRLADIDRFSE